MGFLIDDCAPQTVDEIFFHADIYERLKKMSKENSIPHVIFHGEPGSGKKTMVNIFLDMIYRGESKITTTNRYKIAGSGSKVKEEMIEGSRHHIIIKPTGTNFDRYLVHNVVKSYAGSRAITSKSSLDSKFRVIQISNLDRLSQSAQNSLRRMIEVNSNRCRFVMWANNLSNVIGPLKSRGFCIRVPRPASKELFSYLSCIAVERGFSDIPFEKIEAIVEYSENNIKEALWCLQSTMYGYPYETNYDRAIKTIVDLICECNLGYMDDKVVESGIRDRLFNLMITNYIPVEILKSIMKEFLHRDTLSEKTKMEIIMQTSKTEYDMVRARREIIHFDAYVSAVMRIIFTNRQQEKKAGVSTKTVVLKK
jgi:DNA polymerase III delta prime subunit